MDTTNSTTFLAQDVNQPQLKQTKKITHAVPITTHTKPLQPLTKMF